VPSLEVFARLGFCDLDLNLNHIVDGGLPPSAVREALAANGQRVWIASGGWCDFFDAAPASERTFASVARQVELARGLGVDRMRLFFGRLPLERFDGAALGTIAANVQRVADAWPDMRFYFENHDGASSRPEVCRDVLLRAARPNVQLNFDPINFEHAGVSCAAALPLLAPLVGHVHLKGYSAAGFCGFG